MPWRLEPAARLVRALLVGRQAWDHGMSVAMILGSCLHRLRRRPLSVLDDPGTTDQIATSMSTTNITRTEIQPPRIVVIGASTGGLAALRSVISAFPADLNAAVLVVMHVGQHKSIFPELLSAHSALPVRHAEHEASLRTSEIWIAPPDRHLLVNDGRVRADPRPQGKFHETCHRSTVSLRSH